MHILILTDRDWTHPQGGGTGTNLYGQVSRWLEWGHRVTVIAGSYPGAEKLEELGDLTIHRFGGRGTVFPRAIWRQSRGLVPDADVVLEVINGITFLTPLWLRTPRVALLHHIHRDHYVRELGRPGAVAAMALETLPLKLLYRGTRFMCISEAAADDVVDHGIPRENIDVNYIGVELEAFEPGARTAEPTLLYLGRLKKYKQLGVLLDVLEQVPEATLDMAGDGDQRDALEEEIAGRGLTERVRLHGHVDEDKKLELLQSTWVNLSASSAEGWCLTVMEAAACATPSAALAVGGLKESIVDGQTGLLAETAEELGEKTARLVRDGELRETLGRQALERAEEFTWDRTAAANLKVLEAERDREREQTRSLVRSFAASDTGRAAGLAGGVIAGNMLALIFTVVFARILGGGDYGSLAALVSALIILMVPGSALQIAVARETSRAVAEGDPDAGASVPGWLRTLIVATLVVAVLAIPARTVVGELVNVEEQWAAWAVPVSAMMWVMLSVERGALQGFQRYQPVALSIMGEALLRLVAAAGLVAAGTGVTGAFLGSGASMMLMAVILWLPLRKCLPDTRAKAKASLRSLMAGAWAPVVGLTLLFALQEVHIIVVKHEATADAAGSYAVAAVAAKGIIWVAVGLGMYLLPEAARRSSMGIDARPVLLRTLGLIVAAAVPLLAVFTFAAKPLLSAVFGPDLTEASGALPWLGLAMTLLACAYLSVQYLLALGRWNFIWVLGVAAAVEVGLLAAIGGDLTSVAVGLTGLMVCCATTVFVISLRSRSGDQPYLTA